MYTDYRIVTQVERKKKKFSGVLRACMIILAVLFILMGIVFSRGLCFRGF